MQPSVGIFWFYKNKIIGKTYSLSEAEKYGEFLVSKLGHYEYWENIQKSIPELRYEEYETIPRGQVVYNIENDAFVLISSKKIIKCKSAVKAIKTFFSIPENARLLRKSDFHYEMRA